MSEGSAIEWTHHTFNPWWGCMKVSPGCDHCYAERDAHRYAPRLALWGKDSDRRFFGENHWKEPIKWNARCGREGIRERVFCASMADVFDNHEGVGGMRQRMFRLIRDTPHLDWLLLTKRVSNILKMLPDDWGDGYPNVWMGISVVNQAEADRDVPRLLEVPARVRFLSCEPLLGPIEFGDIIERNADEAACCSEPGCEFCDGTGTRLEAGLHWVIVGGESGPAARPMNLAWALGLRDHCVTSEIPVFMKQLGTRPEFSPGPTAWPIRHQKGADMAEWPENLRIREFPAFATRSERHHET